MSEDSIKPEGGGEQVAEKPTVSPISKPKVTNRLKGLGKILKSSFFVVVALSIVAGNFVFEQTSVADATDSVEKGVSLDFAPEVQNIIPQNGVMRFADEETYKITQDVTVKDAEDDTYLFTVNSGKFWTNLSISNAKTNFVLGKIVLIPDDAAFDLEYSDARLQLSVHRGDVYIGFLEDGILATDYLDEYSDLFMNTLLVPQNSRVTVPMSKVTNKIAPLLYSKLVKEFKYSAISQSEKDSDWVKVQLNKDRSYIEKNKQDLSSEILSRGNIVPNSPVSRLLFWAEEYLTFIPEKRQEVLSAHLFNYLDDAIYYASSSALEDMQSSYNNFVASLSLLPPEVHQSDEFKSKFDSYLNLLKGFYPGDKQYKVYEKLLDELKKTDITRVTDLHWSDTYESMDVSKTMAELTLEKHYASYLDNTFGSFTDEDKYLQYIGYQNQLFDNLFLRYPTFYSDEFFAIKDVLEHELLDLIFEGQLKDEFAQDLISNKINFSKRLMSFFFDEEMHITVDDAKDVLFRLLDESEDLMPGTDKGVAVIGLFKTQLKDIDDFWGYLSSNEYNSSKAYGKTHKERYEVYLQDKKIISSIQKLQEDVFGDPVETLTIKDVKEEVEDALHENDDVTEVEVGEIKSAEQRYVTVQAVIGGYPFEAVYDRDKGSVKEVYTYGELISEVPVNLNGLHALLVEKFTKLAKEGNYVIEDEDVLSERYAERLARIYITEKVSDEGFIVDMENVSVLDSLNAVYTVKDAYVEGFEDVKVSFDFLMSGEKATNLFLIIEDTPVVLDGKYSLSDVKNLIEAEATKGESQALIR